MRQLLSLQELVTITTSHESLQCLHTASMGFLLGHRSYL